MLFQYHTIAQTRSDGLRSLTEVGFYEVMTQFNEQRLDINDATYLLSRIEHPDTPNLSSLISYVWKNGGFNDRGNLERCFNLLPLSQLNRMSQETPSFLLSERFVFSVLEKLAPLAHWDVEKRPQDAKAYFARLNAFAMNLSPKFDPVRVLILQALLKAFRTCVEYAPETPFREYLAIPKSGFVGSCSRFGVSFQICKSEHAKSTRNPVPRGTHSHEELISYA
jgi:hypothetical protein